MAIVALIPEPNDIPCNIGEQHITLAYFGDDDLPDNLKSDVLDAVENTAKFITSDENVEIIGFEWFGEKGETRAYVALLDNKGLTPPIRLRSIFLDFLTEEAREYLDSQETYPTYKPHMTMVESPDDPTEMRNIESDFDIPMQDRIYISGIGLWDNGIRHDYSGRDLDVEVTSLSHYGTPRHSGRYPWGSGQDPYQSGLSFMGAIDVLKEKNPGISEPMIAKAMGMTTTELRARKSIASNSIRQAQVLQIQRMKAKGMSNVAIGERLGIPEPTVRNRLKAFEEKKQDKNIATAEALKEGLKKHTYLEVGEGSELYLGVSPERMKTALVILQDEGYGVRNIHVEQLGNPGNYTPVRVLVPPGTTGSELYAKSGEIGTIATYTENDGVSFTKIQPPVSVDPKRVAVKYGPDGGSDMDGVIQLRRGVEDLSLGNSNYAQVRIKVGDDHYLKGMAIYADDLPAGVDIMFNTNKKSTGNKLDAMKPLKGGPEEANPFGATFRQKTYETKSGEKKLSPLNIVGHDDPSGVKHPGEEGGWNQWSKKLSSQMLSKQPDALARAQLDQTYQLERAELDTIKSLTNPTVKKYLLDKYADGVDSSATKLKAAALPGTANHVLLPFKSIKENEVYAPGYKNGERVVLIRHPHGGLFEIPELIVNNRNQEALKIIPNAKDAVGINPKVAQRLSGADFDGDTVLVIPNPHGKIKTAPALEGLKDFDPQVYKYTIPNPPKMKSATTQNEMGRISNLITDMTLQGATPDELSRAVRHSMVVIDAEKHGLDYKQSAKDNAIAALKTQYQGGPTKGASTLISKASSDVRVPEQKLRKARDGGRIDPKTGELVYVKTGSTYEKTTKYKDGRTKTETVARITKAPAMSLVKDAHTLSSGTSMEKVYGDHANRLKALANEARKEAYATPNLKMSPSAKAQYAPQVASLNEKLKTALMNKPLERVAQIKGNVNVSMKKAANPDLTKDQIKKLKVQELAQARALMGAKRQQVNIVPEEWEAIQAGAVSDNVLRKILQNTDVDKIKEYSMPRDTPLLTGAKLSRAQAMMDRGYTRAEVAEQLGVSVTTLDKALQGK